MLGEPSQIWQTLSPETLPTLPAGSKILPWQDDAPSSKKRTDLRPLGGPSDPRARSSTRSAAALDTASVLTESREDVFRRLRIQFSKSSHPDGDRRVQRIRLWGSELSILPRVLLFLPQN